MAKDKPVLKKPSVFDFDVDALEDVPAAMVQQVYGDRQPERDRRQRAIQRRIYGAFERTDIGLVIGDNPSVEDWEDLGRDLIAEDKNHNWNWGDWLAFGEDVHWGDIPKIADAAGRNADTLRNYASVSRLVKFSCRNENLTYTHHVVVALEYLTDEQKIDWLNRAQANGWKTRQLRAEMEKAGVIAQDNLPALPGADEAEDRKILRKIAKKTVDLTESEAKEFSPKQKAEHLGYIQMQRRMLDEREGWLKG